MKTVKTLQLSANLAQPTLGGAGDPELVGLVQEAMGLLVYAQGAGLDKIVQFSIEVDHISGGSTKLQYARRDA